MMHRLRRYDVFRFAQNDVAPVGRNVKWNSPTFAKRIFHSEAISHGKAIFHSPKANFVEKSTHCLGRQMCAFFWWGMVDSDHRSQWQQIYSLPPLAAREIPHVGAGERSRTINLLITNQLLCHWATPAFRSGLSPERYRLYHIRFSLSIPFLNFFILFFVFLKPSPHTIFFIWKFR